MKCFQREPVTALFISFNTNWHLNASDDQSSCRHARSAVTYPIRYSSSSSSFSHLLQLITSSFPSFFSIPLFVPPPHLLIPNHLIPLPPPSPLFSTSPFTSYLPLSLHSPFSIPPPLLSLFPDTPYHPSLSPCLLSLFLLLFLLILILILPHSGL